MKKFLLRRAASLPPSELVRARQKLPMLTERLSGLVETIRLFGGVAIFGKNLLDNSSALR
jgi:hypothetical protein